ncbi:DUF2807 domain-containing protein [Aquimarina sp. U1-2]|uniref:GIN domain-containing protein n=1 Tax=Aquimarina sp. U1-2 TaxID=2823141 RepID=UPI001AECFC65|nr:DUF2807 domain-containing protein [Aquimarina sp. U1-2]MBP2833413.1 DUF2807 domain-containing protein [Aquimarina sp. U1-2]
MKISLLILCTTLFFGTLYSQKEKVKGNKIVATEELDVEGFHTIEVYDNFEVSLEESSDHQVRIKADSNLQDFIQIVVQDSVLTITSDKDLRRAKALHLDIFYASEVKKIRIFDKVQLKSILPITSGELKIESNDIAEIFLTTDTRMLECTVNGKSTAEFHVTSKEIVYQVNDNAEIKGIITSDSLKVDVYQKGRAKLEGEVQSMLVRADNDSDFYGEKLNAAKTKIIAESNSDCYILSSEEIIIDARDNAEIFLLGEPKILIEAFLNEASLFKKNIDYTPSKLRLN